MKVFIGIILVVAYASAQASAAEIDVATCVKSFDDSAKKFVISEPISQLVTKLEGFLDFDRVIDLSSGKNTTTYSLMYAINVDRPEECTALMEDFDKIMGEVSCVTKISLAPNTPARSQLLNSTFGNYLRAYLACSITQTIEYSDVY